MNAASGDRGVGGTTAANRGSLKVIHAFQARRWFARLRDQRVGHRGQSLMERVPVPDWKVG